MTLVLQNLIDKQDSFEIVRDQIALILANEVINQKALATAASIDPTPWDIRIFLERANIWESFRRSEDARPIVNIWFDSFSILEGQSNLSERQTNEVSYNIDCYGYGVSSDDGATGHNPGDEVSALEVAHTIRLVRNILMASINQYLQLQGLVGQRRISNCQSFQPESGNQAALQVTGARMVLGVRLNEFAPQYEGVDLEKFTSAIKSSETGEILGDLEIDYPLT